MFPFHRALVTGGAGFIGSHLVEELLTLGLEVISIDNYVTGKHANLTHLNSPCLREVKCDVNDYGALKPWFEGVDIVFHEAASKKTVCARDPRLDLETNAKGTFNILELARDFQVKKVVHASTGSVYGEALYFPQDEDHLLNPTSYYGVSKLAGEKYAMAFRHLYGLDVTVLRYFHVYGPRQDYSDDGGVVAIFGSRVLQDQPPIIYGDGQQQRSFTYVKDVVAANLLVAADPRACGQVYNCASGIRVTIRELADLTLKFLNKEHLGVQYADWKLGDIKVFDVDNARLRSLGFALITPFEVGLQETLEWLRQDLESSIR